MDQLLNPNGLMCVNPSEKCDTTDQPVLSM